MDSLTKDISLQAGILDLIDNAVDAVEAKLAEKLRPGAPSPPRPESYRGYTISLTITAGRFVISDNGIGISPNALIGNALRFGVRSERTHGIGTFGVGLNRALFKLGRHSTIHTDTGVDASEFSIDTAAYSKDPGWSLPARKVKSAEESGTEITIEQIPEEAAREFADAAFLQKLKEEIGEVYCRFIEKKLKIVVNRTPVPASVPHIRSDGPYATQSKVYSMNDGVAVYLQAGQHRHHRFGAEADYDKDANAGLTPQYGWTVFCNDRAVVRADKTPRTGWDTKFHSEFYGFVGTVDFYGDASKLPWTTTKADVDRNNAAYQSALIDMRRFAASWRRDATDAKKKKRLGEPLRSMPAAKGTADKKPKSKTVIKKRTVIKVDHNAIATILPRDVDERFCEDKHLALVHEAKTMVLGDFPYSGLMLIRVLFEASVVTYMSRHHAADGLQLYVNELRSSKKSPSSASGSDITPSLDEALGYLSLHPEIFGAGKANHLKHSLARMQYHKKKMNSVAHNAWQPINRGEAFAIRDEILPILRHMIEQ